MVDLTEFLESLALGQYLSVFNDNDVDFETLHHLTDDDLISLGLSLGHRRKLSAALNFLETNETSEKKQPRTEQEDVLAERRQLTVMFCDLVGSTKLSAQLDPEDLRRLMQQYHHAVSQTIVDHGGHVAKLLGDGVLAYFGFPDAKENDSENAVRAARNVVSSVSQVSPVGPGAPDSLEVRIGIATGTVVIGDMTGASVTDFDSVVGETPNLAARLQTLADPGSIVISAETHALVGDVFDYEALGAQQISGFSDPLPAWRVLHEKTGTNRFDVLRGADITDLVGRSEEADLLRRRWASVEQGTGSVVFISGEAGIGKSRLLKSLRREIVNDDITRLQFQCSNFHRGTAFAPVIGYFEHVAGFAHDDNPERRLSKFKSALGENPNEIIASLLRLKNARTMSDIEPDPELRREHVLVELMEMVELRSAKGPMLIVFEDLHWSDDSTLEFVNRVVDAASRLPILLVVTARPGVEVAWTNDPHVSFMMLKRLDRKAVRALIQAVTQDRSLPAGVQDQIAQRTDGVPLFIEELTRSILHSDYLREDGDRLVVAGAIPQQAIPMTLQETLMARLDRLSPVKDVAQLGAVIGRRFTADLILVAYQADQETLFSSLRTLELEGLLSRRGSGSEAVYEFRHALIQEAAYGSLLKSRRSDLHERIGRHLMEHAEYSDPAMIAYHLTEAGLRPEAIDFWIAAGDRSNETAGFAEALENYSRALEHLREISASEARHAKEIDVLLSIGPCQVQVLGPASDEVYETYFTALQLGDDHGAPEQRFKALWGLWFYYFMLGAVPKMHDLANRLIPLAKEIGDEALELEGHHCEWAALSLLGDFAGALTSTEKGIEAYEEEKHHWMTFHYGGHDPGLCAHSLKAVNLCVLGYPDRAKEIADKAIGQAIRLNHGYSLLETLFCSLIVMMLRSEYDAINSQAGRLIALTDAGRLPPEARDLASGFVGWVETETGSETEGLARMERSISGWQGFWGAWCFPLDAAFALALAQKGNAEAALQIVETASEMGGNTGGHWWDAEFNRIRGNILLCKDASEHHAAKECFERAKAAAQARQARLFELRAAVDLTKLRLQSGDLQAARDHLEPILTKFTEGRDLPDFLRAREILDRCNLE